MFNNFFFFRAGYEIMSKNLEKADGQQMTILRLVACWIIKATRVPAHVRARATPYTHTHTHTHKYVILIAFLR